MLHIDKNWVCKAEKPYHRTGKSGAKQCQQWDEEDFEQMKKHLNEEREADDGSEME